MFRDLLKGRTNSTVNRLVLLFSKNIEYIGYSLVIVSLTWWIWLQSSYNGVVYPYHFPDSWDWLTNGLYVAGHNVVSSWRPPILPMIIAALYTSNLQSLIPFVGLVSLHALAAFVIFISSRYSDIFHLGQTEGLLFACLLLSNGFVLASSFYIGADMLATTFMFMAVAIFALILYKRPKLWWLGALLWALSGLTQYVGIFLAVPFAWVLFRHKKELLYDKKIWGLFILAGLLTSTYFIYKWLALGSPFYSKVEHLRLVGLNMTGIPYYAWSTIGASGIITSAFFLYALLRNRRFQINPILIASFLLPVVFFVIFYSWLDKRFCIYWLPFLIFFAVKGFFSSLRSMNTKIKWIFAIIVLVSWFANNSLSTEHFSRNTIPVLPGIGYKGAERDTDIENIYARSWEFRDSYLRGDYRDKYLKGELIPGAYVSEAETAKEIAEELNSLSIKKIHLITSKDGYFANMIQVFGDVKVSDNNAAYYVLNKWNRVAKESNEFSVINPGDSISLNQGGFPAKHIYGIRVQVMGGSSGRISLDRLSKERVSFKRVFRLQHDSYIPLSKNILEDEARLVKINNISSVPLAIYRSSDSSAPALSDGSRAALYRLENDSRIGEVTDLMAGEYILARSFVQKIP